MGIVIFSLAECQVGRKIINQKCFNKLKNDLQLYKTNKVGYESYITNLLNHWATGLKGQSYPKVLKETILFLKGTGNKFYNFVKPVIQILEPTHDIYFITGEPKFVGEAAASIFHTEGFISSELSLSQSLFTGKVQKYLARRSEKLSAIQHLLKTYSYNNSLAIGGSEGDIQMLSSVQNAICINATDGLKKYAKEQKWHIVNPKNITSLVSLLAKT